MNDDMPILGEEEKKAALEARIKELEEKLAGRENDAAERAARLLEELKPYLEKYKSGGEELIKLATEKVRENPGASLAVAFAVGLVAARLFERRK